MIDVRTKVRVAGWLLLLPTLIWAGTPSVRAADEKPAVAKEEKTAPEAKAKKAPVDYRGPLPFYYTKVLSPDQKEKMYVITEKYAAEIKSLQVKLRELEAAREKELEAALTPEQAARIKELRAEAAKAKTAKPDAGK